MTGELVSQFLQREFEREAADAMRACGFELANQIGEAANVCPEQVFGELAYVPDQMLTLLASPDGWASLAQFIAAEMGLPPLSYRPQIH